MTTPPRAFYTLNNATVKGMSIQTKKTALTFLALLVLLAALGLWGCANQTGSEAGAMLSQDYRKMDNDEMLL